MDRFRPLEPPSLTEPDPDSFLHYYEGLEQRHKALFGAVTPSGLYTPANPWRHRLIFYDGHPFAFFDQKGRSDKAGYWPKPVDAGMLETLSIGVSPDHPCEVEGLQGDWPAHEAVQTYKRTVSERFRELLTRIDQLTSRQIWAVAMGLEHMAIHLQTTVPLMRQLPLEYLTAPEGWASGLDNLEDPGVDTGWTVVDHARVLLGRPHDDRDQFGWDNEFGRKEVEVASFAMRRDPITNAEFSTFVSDGGYTRAELWTKEGQRWLAIDHPQHPAAWVRRSPQHHDYRSLFEEHNMPDHAPVELNHHEATAFAAWMNTIDSEKGYRLPTEAEYWAAYKSAYGPRLSTPVEAKRFNVDWRFGGVTPVRAIPTSVGHGGLNLQGNVARWVAGDFNTLTGFRSDPLYADFSKPWTNSGHGMLVGAGWTAVGHLKDPRMRDFMQKQMDQVAGLQLVRTA